MSVLKRIPTLFVIFAVAIVMAAAVAVSKPAPANAANLHVYGNACPGGYILAMFYNDSWESGAATFAGNNFDIHLSQYDGDEDLHMSIKCNNNVWYFPVRHISGFINPFNLGWV